MMYAQVKKHNERARAKELKRDLPKFYYKAYIEHEKACAVCDKPIKQEQGNMFVYNCGCPDIHWEYDFVDNVFTKVRQQNNGVEV